MIWYWLAGYLAVAVCWLIIVPTRIRDVDARTHITIALAWPVVIVLHLVLHTLAAYERYCNSFREDYTLDERYGDYDLEELSRLVKK